MEDISSKNKKDKSIDKILCSIKERKFDKKNQKRLRNKYNC